MQAVRDWDLYAGVPLGALIERRSLRQIDFAPARPALIRRAVGQAPAGSADMERIGTPAKGLPALEWLLWQAPLKLATPECAYAVQVAADIDREATQLQRDADAAAAREATPEEATAAFAELLNQWVGSSERLRWADLDKPRREAASRGEKDTPPAWPRALSGQTSAAWAAHWQALARLAAMAGSAAPAPGAVLVTLEAYLHELTLRLDSMAAATPPPPKANTWQYPGGEKANNMRRGIIAIFKNTGRSTAQAIAWAEKQGVHGQKKAFNDYTTGELYVLLGLAEKIRTQQEQKTRKTFLDQ